MGSRMDFIVLRSPCGKENGLHRGSPLRRPRPSSASGGRERRQLPDVAHVVLDDHGRLQVRGELLHAIERRDGLRAVVVEPRHAVALVVLAEMHEVAAQNHWAHVLQPHEQGAVAGRVARCLEHDDGAVAEHVLVGHERLDLAGGAHELFESRDVRALHRRLSVDRSQWPWPIRSVALGNGASWPVWSPWKWLIPTYLTCSGFTLSWPR